MKSIGLSVEEGIGAYKRSKIAAERLVEAMVASENLPAVIVNPSTPIGPRDVKPTPTGRIIVEAARGRMPGFVDTGLNFVHVDDVAEGHLAAFRRGRIGERYILGGENVLLADMLADSRALDRPSRRRVADSARRRHSGGVPAAETTACFTGRPPFTTRDGSASRSTHVLHRGQGRARSRLPGATVPAGARRRDRWFGAAGYLDAGRNAERPLVAERRAGQFRPRNGGTAPRARPDYR